MRIALAQINTTVGDINGNVDMMKDYYNQALEYDCDIIVFPEMAICGYPPEDLLLKKHFIEDTGTALEKFAADCPRKTIIAGFAEPQNGKCYNSLAVLSDGQIKNVYRKGLLPNYGVFDEHRYFKPGEKPLVIEIDGLSIVLTICEDIWQMDWLAAFLKDYNKDLLINISASPFHMGKIDQKVKILSDVAVHFNCALAYCNLVGGQDELVFDGQSMFLNPNGVIAARARAFDQDLLIADIQSDSSSGLKVKQVPIAGQKQKSQPLDLISEVYGSLVLGTRDYLRKNGFDKVVIGLSGGIDSSLVAAVAVDAVGSENVVGVTMPSRFNSPDTITDAQVLADNLGIEFHTIPIGTTLDVFNNTLNDINGWDDKSTAYENLQSRIRGTILMSLSNQFGYIVLTTGNKSETAVGYSTLYGDTAGGFALLKDVPKTLVYRLSKYVNILNAKEIIPDSVITRIPSAELRDNQKDSDSLPDYDLLDRILKGFVEQDKSAKQLINEGLPADVVKRIIRMVDINEYKRRQSPPGIKISPKAFGKDRRMPITNRYRPF